MGKRSVRSLGLGLVLATIGLLIPTGALFAQMSDREGAAAGLAVLGGMLFFMLAIFAVFYVYLALALSTIAKKTNTENAWWGWVPILNIVLMLNIAKKPIWWIILFIIPVVSLVMAIIVWMAIAEARGKPNWWGILLIVPVFGLVVPGYLAWSD
jgi:Family of unknown function (DUF5684)